MGLSPIPMLLADEEGQIRLVNREFEQLFEYAEGALLGWPVEVLLPEAARGGHPALRRGFAAEPSKRQMGQGRDLFGLTRTQRVLPLELGLQPVAVDDVVWVLVTAVDISERRAAQEARREAEQRVARYEQLNEALTQFAYSASHDLKAPLVTVSGVLALALEDLEQGHVGVATENLTKIRSIVDNAARKVEGTLRLARIGYEKFPVSHIDLEAKIREVWQELTLNVARPPRFEVQMGSSLVLATSEAALDAIVENLLSNSIRFSDPYKDDRWISVSVRQQDDRVRIEVQDNGIGIAAGQQRNVFAAFRRFSASSGDGLGLAIVNRYVTVLGGQITFTSEAGRGTRFTLDLPMEHER